MTVCVMYISLKTTDNDDDEGGNDEELFENFSFVLFVLSFFGNRSCRCDSVGLKIVEIEVILAIFRPFEDFSLQWEIFRYKLTEIKIGSHGYKLLDV